MADAIDPITANPDTNNPAAFPVQADLAWSQLKIAIPQINDVIAAFNLNDVEDVSTSSVTIGNGAKTFTISADKSFRKGMNLTIADAALPADNLMQGIVTGYSGTTLSVQVIQTRGSGTIADWVISLSVMPMLEYDDIVLKLTTGNGVGSTNTRIMRYTTVATNTATDDLEYTDSATLGGSIKFLRAGWYRVKLVIITSAGNGAEAGVSVNSNQLATNISSITQSNVVSRTILSSPTTQGRADVVAFFNVDDVIRGHLNGAGSILTDGNTTTELFVQKVSLSGVSTGGGSGGGAPDDAQYIVAAADATLSNERVPTNTASILVDFGTAGQMLIKRAAISGDVVIQQDLNTAVIPANTVTNLQANDMPAYSAKVNPGIAVGDPQDLVLSTKTMLGRGTGDIVPITLTGSAEMSAAGVLKTKGAWAFDYTYGTNLVMQDPGAGVLRFDTTTIATIASMAIDPIMLGGRDITAILDDADIGGKFCFISNNATSTAWGYFDITDIDNLTTHYVFSFNTATNKGVMPTGQEQLLIFFIPSASAGGLDTDAVLAMGVARFDSEGFLINNVGTRVSGPGSVATQADLIALDDSLYTDFVMVCDDLNRSAHVGYGTEFRPLNGQYIHEMTNTVVQRVVAVNAVTWVASNNGGTVRITAQSDASHGLTSASIGASLYLTNAPANWTAGTLHAITAVNDSVGVRTVDLSTAWVASMGTPTFAGVNVDIPVASIALPILRANTRWIFECSPTFPAAAPGASSTTNHIVTKLDTTQITDCTLSAASNRCFVFRSGFKNINNAAIQSGIWGAASTGFAASGVPNVAGVNTGVAGKTWNVFLAMNLVNTPFELPGYICTIQG